MGNVRAVPARIMSVLGRPCHPCCAVADLIPLSAVIIDSAWINAIQSF
jgi:hypothetical protein